MAKPRRWPKEDDRYSRKVVERLSAAENTWDADILVLLNDPARSKVARAKILFSGWRSLY
jgi:hypothetical protein